MKKTLVIMAAGLGSRFGGAAGQKQVTPVDENGHLIIDYSAYDAMRAGFEKVVFVIKPESESVFHELIGKNVQKHMEVAYAHQTLESRLPAGFKVPEGRVNRMVSDVGLKIAARSDMYRLSRVIRNTPTVPPRCTRWWAIR